MIFFPIQCSNSGWGSGNMWNRSSFGTLLYARVACTWVFTNLRWKSLNSITEDCPTLLHEGDVIKTNLNFKVNLSIRIVRVCIMNSSYLKALQQAWANEILLFFSGFRGWTKHTRNVTDLPSLEYIFQISWNHFPWISDRVMHRKLNGTNFLLWE